MKTVEIAGISYTVKMDDNGHPVLTMEDKVYDRGSYFKFESDGHVYPAVLVALSGNTYALVNPMNGRHFDGVVNGNHGIRFSKIQRQAWSGTIVPITKAAYLRILVNYPTDKGWAK